MRSLMKEDVHFGTIPGTPKPTLYKAGAELLLMTFRIAAAPACIEDLSTPDEARYRVTMRGTNQVTGEVLGEMSGECSSSETKYRWVKPVCDQEWEETDPALRREKWLRSKDGPYKQRQVRSSPADVANTILKMATKRALIALTLTALAASDIFAQDLEDLAEELRETVGDDKPRPGDGSKGPQRKSARTNSPPASAPTPPHAETVRGVVAKVYADKAPFGILLKGSSTKFTTFDEKVAKAAQQFEGTDHTVQLSYTTTTKGDRTYHNAVGLAIADDQARPVATPAEQPTLTAGDIPFGGGR